MMTIKLALDSPRGGKRARNMVEGEAAPGMHDQVVTIQRYNLCVLAWCWLDERVCFVTLIHLVHQSASHRQAPAAEADAGARTNSKPNSSKYRGVTKHVRTGRWEAHIWCLNRQLYLGGFDTEGQAAIAYDLAAINIKGLDAAITNFDKSKYASQLGTIMKVGGGEWGGQRCFCGWDAAISSGLGRVCIRFPALPHIPHTPPTHTDEAGGAGNDPAQHGQAQTRQGPQVQVQGHCQTRQSALGGPYQCWQPPLQVFGHVCIRGGGCTGV